MSTNDGFWQGGMVATPDRLNANMTQRGTLATRPAAGMKGRQYILTDSGLEGQTFYDDGSTWQTGIDVDPTDDTVAALHTIGTEAHNGSAGNHTHTLAEEGSDEGSSVGSIGQPLLGADVAPAGNRNSPTVDVVTDETARVCAVGCFAIEGSTGSGWDIDLTIDAVSVDSATGVQTSGDGYHILKGSRVTTTDTTVVCLAKSINQGSSTSAIQIGCGGVGVSI